jgi:hypothetical protein
VEILYRHKQSRVTIPLREIMENYELKFSIQDFNQYYEYQLKDVPLSIDFETVCIDEEFTTDELGIIIYALNCIYFGNDQLEIKNKVRNKFNTLMSER